MATGTGSLPTPFGRYLLRRKLAKGGMAEIFLAEQVASSDVSKMVVVKRMLSHLCRSEPYVKMFLDEARLASRLSHPNVVQVFDFGEIDGQHYLTMEYLAGETLSEVLRQARAVGQGIPLDIALQVLCDVCEGLHYAHQHTEAGAPMNVVHRDVSPSNVMVTYHGAVKVVDFGIARMASRIQERTGPGLMKGKLSYISPEQYRNLPLDRRADVFAAGVVLFELLAGLPLFRRATDEGTMRAVIEEEPPPLAPARSDVPPELDRILARAMAKERDARTPTADALRRELEVLLGGRRVRLDDWLRELFGEDRAQERIDAAAPLGTPDDLTITSTGTPHAGSLRAILTPPVRTSPARRRARLAAVSGRKLVGREAELATLGALLATGRLVSLLGPGGIGKTRLALAAVESARRGEGSFAEVLFCALGAERTTEAMCRALAVLLDVAVAGGASTDTVAASIGSALRARGRTLLVLDEIEHLVPDAVDCVEIWLEEAPELVVLATSRHALSVPAEQSMEVTPLRVPRSGEHDPEAAAVAMFVECVRAFRRDYAPGPTELTAIEEIVRRLDGVPLAIELAAARLRLLSAAELRLRLDDPVKGVAGPALVEAIERSWGLLDSVEQRVLAQCSVFRRGFTPEAAEAVLDCDGDGVPVLDVLQSLREKSLLAAEAGEPVRLSLLESIRAYAARRLDETGSTDALRDRHAAHYARAAAAAADRENLCAALAHRTGRADALPLVVALGQLPDDATAEELALVEKAVGSAGAADLNVTAAAQEVLARMLVFLERPAAAEPLYRDVLQRATDLGDIALTARATAGLATTLYRQYRMEEARSAYEQAVLLARRIGDRALQAQGQNRLAATLGSMGRLDEAVRVIEAAAEGSRRHADPSLASAIASTHGTLLLESGDHEGAARRYDEARRLAEKAGLRRRQGVVGGYLALAELGAGRFDDAEQHVTEALARSRFVGHREAIGAFLAFGAAIAAARGDLEAAQERLAESFALCEHDPGWRAVNDLYGCHLDIAEARAAAAGGDQGRARARLMAAVRRLAETRSRRMPVETEGRLPPLLVEVSDDVRIGILLLQQALDAARGELPAVGPSEGEASDRSVLTVGQGGAWFTIDGGERVDLAGRAVLRRVLWSLCERQLDTPGRAVSTRELCAAAWPGERMRPRSGASRLYVTLGELRKLGLRDVIASDGGGYSLRCEIRVVF